MHSPAQTPHVKISPGIRALVDLSNDLNYLDQAPIAEVKLVVEKRGSSGTFARELLWLIMWNVGDSSCNGKRILSLERGPGCAVNRGPITQDVSYDGWTHQFSLGVLSLAQRKKLEKIAMEVPATIGTRPVDYMEWVADLLQRAVEADVLSKAAVDQAMCAARA